VAEWKPYQIAAAGEIAALAEGAAALADTVKSTLTLANVAMEVVKLLAQLQSINPLLIALDALADEILKQLADLKEAGYYYLFVDPYFIKNVNPEPAFTYGFEQSRNEGGDRVWMTRLVDDQGNLSEEFETTDTPTEAQIKAKNWARPKLSTPRKLIPGGYNPKSFSVDPLALISPYPKFSTKQVISEFTKAFDDEGDVPRYKSLGSAPKKGTIVYDKEGEPYSGWDKTKDFGVQLYDIGSAQEDGSTIKDYVAARKAVNNRISSGKPNIGGNTEFEGTGSAAIAIIIAAPSFDIFTDTFNQFSQMFSDIPEFAAATGQSLLDSFSAILAPDNIVIKLTQVDTDYKIFATGDIIGGKIYGGLAEVKEVDDASIVPTTMVAQKEMRLTDDARNVIRYVETVSVNPERADGTTRWVDMELTAAPIRSADGINPFLPGDEVFEMEVRGETGEGLPNYVEVGKDTTELPRDRRIYPKTGKVGMEKLAELPDSTPPDFGGIQIKDLIPGWGEFFQILENFVKQLKGMISDSAAFIQDIIDMIKDIEKFLGELVATIEGFLEFFEVTLPSTGIYALRIPNQNGGNEGLKSLISGSSGLPDLAYAAGILFVGTEVGGINPIDLLAKILQLD